MRYANTDFSFYPNKQGLLSALMVSTMLLAGCGGGSSSSSGSTNTVAGAPTIGTATAGNASASIAFTAPTSNGGAAITAYTATCVAGSSSITGSNTASPISVTGLTNGTTYSCTVTATNSVGTGAASSAVSVTPAAAATITAKYSSLNTALSSSTLGSFTAVTGTGTSTSTAGVGCSVAGSGSTVTGLVNANNTSNITSNVSNNYSFTWSCANGFRTLTANGIPNHAVGVFPNSGNPNTIKTQTVSVTTIKLAPTKASMANYMVQPPGYGLNGIKFDPNTGGACNDNASAVSSCTLLGMGNWSLEALVSVTPFDFGADANLAHVQPTGEYHYHGSPAGLFAALGGTVTNGVPNKMVLIGWAVDGYPMYYKYGYATANDATSALKSLVGNYLPNSSSTTLSTRPSASIFPLGTFKNDWAYSASNGGDLDECNGRTGVTPEFPNGIYYYVVTDTYPFAPRCIMGNQ